MVVEDQHGRGPGDAAGHVLREAGDPLQAVPPDLPADRGGQRDDPRGRPVGEAQEVGRRVHRVPGAVQPVGGLDQLHQPRLLLLRQLLRLQVPGVQRELLLPQRLLSLLQRAFAGVHLLDLAILAAGAALRNWLLASNE